VKSKLIYRTIILSRSLSNKKVYRSTISSKLTHTRFNFVLEDFNYYKKSKAFIKFLVRIF